MSHSNHMVFILVSESQHNSFAERFHAVLWKFLQVVKTVLLHSELYWRETSVCGSCPSKPGKGWICSTSWKISPGHWCSLVTYRPLKKWKTNPSSCTKNQVFSHLLGSIVRNRSYHGMDYQFDTLQDWFFLACWDDRTDEGWGWSRRRLTGHSSCYWSCWRIVKKYNMYNNDFKISHYYKSYFKVMSCKSLHKFALLITWLVLKYLHVC